MCNLYSITKGPQAIRDFARAMRDTTGNLPPTAPETFTAASKQPLTKGAVQTWPVFAHSGRPRQRLRTA